MADRQPERAQLGVTEGADEEAGQGLEQSAPRSARGQGVEDSGETRSSGSSDENGTLNPDR